MIGSVDPESRQFATLMLPIGRRKWRHGQGRLYGTCRLLSLTCFHRWWLHDWHNKVLILSAFLAENSSPWPFGVFALLYFFFLALLALQGKWMKSLWFLSFTLLLVLLFLSNLPNATYFGYFCLVSIAFFLRFSALPFFLGFFNSSTSANLVPQLAIFAISSLNLSTTSRILLLSPKLATFMNHWGKISTEKLADFTLILLPSTSCPIPSVSDVDSIIASWILTIFIAFFLSFLKTQSAQKDSANLNI